MIKELKNMEGLHRGDTVFVIGNGISLKNLDKNDKKKIECFPSIGTNLSFMSVSSPYYITGHICHLIFSIDFEKNKSLKFMQGKLKGYAGDFIKIYVKETEHTKFIDRVDKDISMIGAENILFSSLNLAYIMKPSRIIFLGIDMISHEHFYDSDPFRETLLEMIKKTKEKYKNFPAIIEDIKDFENININKRITNKYIIEYNRHLKNLITIIKELRKNKVEVYTVDKGGIMEEAAVERIDIKQI